MLTSAMPGPRVAAIAASTLSASCVSYAFSADCLAVSELPALAVDVGHKTSPFWSVIVILLWLRPVTSPATSPAIDLTSVPPSVPVVFNSTEALGCVFEPVKRLSV